MTIRNVTKLAPNRLTLMQRQSFFFANITLEEAGTKFRTMAGSKILVSPQTKTP
jgi:hypothetical protein